MPETLHATCIAGQGKAALLIGPSGAGKSDLALRCLAASRGPLYPHDVQLVADDRVALRIENGLLLASAPAAIAGRIEVRGIGIIEVAAGPEAAVAMVVDLTPGASPPPRMPDPWPTTEVLGVPLPVLRIAAFEASAALKVLIALSIFPVASLPSRRGK